MIEFIPIFLIPIVPLLLVLLAAYYMLQQFVHKLRAISNALGGSVDTSGLNFFSPKLRLQYQGRNFSVGYKSVRYFGTKGNAIYLLITASFNRPNRIVFTRKVLGLNIFKSFGSGQDMSSGNQFLDSNFSIQGDAEESTIAWLRNSEVQQMLAAMLGDFFKFEMEKGTVSLLKNTQGVFVISRDPLLSLDKIRSLFDQLDKVLSLLDKKRS